MLCEVCAPEQCEFDEIQTEGPFLRRSANVPSDQWRLQFAEVDMHLCEFVCSKRDNQRKDVCRHPFWLRTKHQRHMVSVRVLFARVANKNRVVCEAQPYRRVQGDRCDVPVDELFHPRGRSRDLSSAMVEDQAADHSGTHLRILRADGER